MTLSAGCYMVLYLSLYSCIFINMKLINIFSCLIALFCILTLSCSVPMQRVEKSPERVAEKPLYTYMEREGGELGVSSPASVAFGVELLTTANGEMLWESYFAETQKPLFENVIEVCKFFKRKGRWISVDELAKEGVIEVVDNLNKKLTYLSNILKEW